MADKITIIDATADNVTVEISTNSGLKQLSYPRTLTDEEILYAVLNEIEILNKPPILSDVFLSENIGSEIAIKYKEEKLPDEYETVIYAEIK